MSRTSYFRQLVTDLGEGINVERTVGIQCLSEQSQSVTLIVLVGSTRVEF